jgi:hypothetical protein
MASLPLLGAVAAIYFQTGYFHLLIYTGWLLLIMNIYIHAPLVLVGKPSSLGQTLIALIPMAMIVSKQVFSQGSVWGYFLDEAMLESVALMLGFVAMFAFGTGVTGESAWKGLGIGMTLIVVGLFAGCASGIFLAWFETVEQQPVWGIINFLVAFGFATRQKIQLLKSMRDGAFNPDKFADKYMFLIIGALPIWLGGLPLIRWLMWG